MGRLGGERTPREMVSGGKLPKQEFALFGSRVHAEVPDLVCRLRPNMPRFVDAAFLPIPVFTPREFGLCSSCWGGSWCFCGPGVGVSDHFRVTPS